MGVTRALKWLWWHLRFPGMLGPIGLFGHRLTIQWFGVDVRLRQTYLCLRWRESCGTARRWRLYLSPNATPWAATRWLVGRPRIGVLTHLRGDSDG